MDTLFKLSDFFKDKDPFKYLKAPLNLLFVCNITYLLYCSFYPGAPNLKTANQISWSAYFLHGEYIIPFGVFVLVWAFTWLLGRGIFENSNWIITERVRTWLLKQSISKAFNSDYNPDQQSIILAMAKSPRGNWVVYLYKQFITAIPKEKRQRLKHAATVMQDDCSADFVLITRAFIVLIITFCQVNYFGWLLFIGLMLFLLCFAVVLYIAYQFAAIVPIIGYKLGQELEEDESRDKILHPTAN